MNSLSIVLVIAFAFVSYSMGASENCAAPPSEAQPSDSPANTEDTYIDGYEIGVRNLNENGTSDDISLKFHMGHGISRGLDKESWQKLICAGICGVSCIAGKNTEQCLGCISQCITKK